MTEAEWLAGTDPQAMLEFLRGRSSEWKLRLFAAASCPHTWHLLRGGANRRVVGAAERGDENRVAEREQFAAAISARCHWPGEVVNNAEYRAAAASVAVGSEIGDPLKTRDVGRAVRNDTGEPGYAFAGCGWNKNLDRAVAAEQHRQVTPL
jgi:hypothetical protein